MNTKSLRSSTRRAGVALVAVALSLAACDAGYEVCTTHYPDGELWSVRYYRQGLPHRPWIAWHGNGAPRNETEYSEGQRSGTWRTLGRDGRLLFERSYLDDEPHGAWRRFRADGSRASEQFFDRGRPVGIWTWWDADGAVLREERHEEPRESAPVEEGSSRAVRADESSSRGR